MATTAHIDETYVDNAIGQDVRLKMTGGAAGNDSVLDQFILGASSTINGMAKSVGYDAFGSSPPEMIQEATLGLVLVKLYGRKGLKVPEQLLSYVQTFNTLHAMIRSGELEIDGEEPSGKNAVGGSRWSKTSGSDGKPSIMGALRTKF